MTTSGTLTWGNSSHRGTRYGLYWAQLCTRFHVYPSRQAVELVRYDWQGFHCPLPDGRWFLSPVSYVLVGEAYSPDLRGEWVSDFDVPALKHYVRAGDPSLIAAP